MRRLRATLCLTFLLAVISPAGAQGVLEKLISPGSLSAKHAKIETRCSACHLNFNQAAQSRLCESCHKAIAADIGAQRGFHGRFQPAAADCRVCHTDHAGRQAKIVKFDAASFNHDFTEYPLHGKHVGLACASCHLAGRKYRDAPVTCVSCHRKDDVHKGSLGLACASCHAEGSWKTSKFDHDSTKFPLLGAHARARCQSCHSDTKFADTPRECVSCHRKDDAHHGTLGMDCARCHDANIWKSTHFDHGQTEFPLTGRHVSVPCRACHTAPADTVKVATACVACHRKDDAHKGGDGPECAQCHTTTRWKDSTFNHAATRFPLLGKHALVACADCHTSPPREKKLATDCYACHAKDDKHSGQLGTQCAQCHGASGWKKDVRFDHEFAPFALIGKHAAVACAQCHASPRFKDASTACVDCHRKDDPHHGALGADCATCHNAGTWKNWIFNHDTQTDFPLTGAHARLTCAACHRDKDKKLSSVCGDCHMADDVHQGAFGRGCERCHSTDSFHVLRNRF